MARYTVDTDFRTVTEEGGTGCGCGALIGTLALVMAIAFVWSVIKDIVAWFQGLWHKAVEFTIWLIHTIVILGLEGSFLIACILAVVTVFMRVVPDKTSTSWRRWALGVGSFTLVPTGFYFYARWLDHLERTSFVGAFTVGHAALSGIGVALVITFVSLRWDKN